MQKLQLVNELMELLPGLDCGSCGAPRAGLWLRILPWVGYGDRLYL